MSSLKNVGFILLRHVNSTLTDKYWKKSYQSIRKIYPKHPILIIDDNSHEKYVDRAFEKQCTHCQILASEFKGRGECLPYYYFHKWKPFPVAIILHDSVFLKKELQVNLSMPCQFLWHFEHTWDQIDDETKMINAFEDSVLTAFYKDKRRWKGCFGGMTMIHGSFLDNICRAHPLTKLLPLIQARYNRCSFERVIGCLLMYHMHNVNMLPNVRTLSLLGDIHKYCRWGITFQELVEGSDENLALVKVWSGR